MAEKKPLVIGSAGQKQQIQAGDFIGVTAGGTGADTAEGARDNLGLSNVENKSSETIRSELTSEDVAEALEFAPIKSARGTANVDFGATPSEYAEITITEQTGIPADSFCQAKIAIGSSNSDFTTEELNSLAMVATIHCDQPDAVAGTFLIRIFLTSGYATGVVPIIWFWS